ncbi:MAG TPA: hypothetical protein VGK59_17555 [Ohtaekwangia sp.]
MMPAVVTEQRKQQKLFCNRSSDITRRIRSFISLIVLAFSITAAHAQEVNVRAGFFEDSLIVGDKVRFYLSAEYDKNLNILFPDSTYNYTPFEFEGKRYFTTKTRDGISYDSVIYELSTFEVDPIQQLQLKVFQVNPGDCTQHVSNIDSIRLSPLVTMSLDTIPVEQLPLKINVAYQDVSWLFNYPVLVIVFSALIVLTAIVWFVFGKRIRKYFKTRRMIKAHEKFVSLYTMQITTLKEAVTTTGIETTLSLWKKYMEQLEAKPYTKLTTRETQLIDGDALLISNLKSIDGAVYGSVKDHSVMSSLEHLKDFADKRFHHKLDKLKHG